MSIEDAAEGIIRIIDVKMEEAIKAISTMRGHDLRDFMLLAFGGAGPLHAGRIARDLGMAGIVVPLYPGVYSAIGLLMSDVKHDYVQSKMTPMSELKTADVNAMFSRLQEHALKDLGADGFGPQQIRVERALDMRYAGQGYEITLPCPAGAMDAAGLAALRKSFDAQHRSMFGHSAPEEPVEVVSYRVRGVGLVPAVELPRFKRERRHAGRRTARDPQGAVRWHNRRVSGVPAREARRRADGRRAGGARPVRLHHGADARPDRAGRRVEEFDCDDETMTDISPIDLEVVKASLSGIVQEMQNSLFRTGFSTIVRESQDASCALINVKGEIVAQHVVLPLHIGAFPACCNAVLKAFGGEMAEGDAFIINHPYQGGSPHAPDICIITPAFFEGELIGFSGSIAHKSDIGGPVPGSCSGSAREVFNEGLHLPAIRYQTRGEQNLDIERLIAANSRTPELVLGDIRGQIGSCRLAEKRLVELMTKYGKAKVLACCERLFALGEAKVRSAVAEWADGRAEAERFVDDDGVDLNKPVRIHVVVEKKGDHIKIDFSGSADQTKGPANIRPPLVQAAVAYVLISLIDPHMYVSSGLLNAYSVKTREGSVLNPRFPAPVNTYNPTVHALVDAIYEAMSRIAPAKVRADGAGSRSIIIGGRTTTTGKGYVQYEIIGGGAGARAVKDGLSGTSVNQSNAKIAPIEILESEFPTRMLRFELIQDSGGPGEHRGGLGIRREYVNLADARFSIRSTKHVIPPNGVSGGHVGRTGDILINPETSGEKRLPTRYADYPLRVDDVFRLDTPGGGGYGDPLARAPERVLADVREGVVSSEAAEREYGVVVGADGDRCGGDGEAAQTR